jgi:hypothetical protein
VSGIDLLNGTPIFDIKPYVPYVDSIPDARGGWTETNIPKFAVNFSDAALSQLDQLSKTKLSQIARDSKSEPITDFKRLITQMLELDPRPTSQKKAFPIENGAHNGMGFGFRVGEIDVKWQIEKQGILVLGVDFDCARIET